MPTYVPLAKSALLIAAMGTIGEPTWLLSGPSHSLVAQEPQVTVPSAGDAAMPAGANVERAESGSKQTEFLRMSFDATAEAEEPVPLSLDTAVVSYGPPQVASAPKTSKAPSAPSVSPSQAGGATVDLIAAVHIGEAGYYAELNRLFDQYDVLLYELVAPEGTVVPLGGRRESAGFNPVGMLQDSAKNMLGLQSQLEKIDYTKAHMVRADLTPTQMSEKMAERGDTAFTLALSALSDAMRQQNLAAQQQQQSAVEALEQIGLSDMLGNPLKMKRVLAGQFAQTGSLDQALGGALNQLLIVDRNAAALTALQKQLAAGKKKIGIFYGAAHLPDLEQHLTEDFGLERGNQRWLKAWDLTTAQEPELSPPAALLLNLLKGLE